MKHLSLFSGIGGFDLAAHWAGWRNVAAVEIDKKCRQILALRFPQTKLYEDVKQFNGLEYAGYIDVVSGGFPCQPFSVAGKRQGNKDDRALWGEMFRVISEIKPRWVVAENVRGLLSIEQGMVFETVCTDLETIGYEVQTFIIPACAVGAPHRRDRVWIVSYQNTNVRSDGGHETKGQCQQFRNAGATNEIRTIADSAGTRLQGTAGASVQKSVHGLACNNFYAANTDGDRASQRHNRDTVAGNDQEIETGRNQANTENTQSNADNGNLNATDTEGKGLQRGRARVLTPKNHRRQAATWNQNWYEVATALCRVDDGVSGRMDRLKQLGNAIVPQVAFEIFSAINEIEEAKP